MSHPTMDWLSATRPTRKSQSILIKRQGPLQAVFKAIVRTRTAR